MNQTQNIALYSCVIIDIIEKLKRASGLKPRLRGKSVKIILCNVVLDKVNCVRGYLPEKVIIKVSSLLGKKIELFEINKEYISNAYQITNQFQICHNGDNKILSLCQARDFILVTFDKMLLKISQFVGITAFHPLMIGGV